MMKKVIRFFSFLLLGIYMPIQAAKEKKVVIVRLVYADGNDGEDGVRIISACKNMKELLKQSNPSKNGAIVRVEVIDIYGRGVLGENLMITGIDNIKEEQIPTYTTEKLKVFYEIKYNKAYSKIPVIWAFESNNWKKREVWLFNKKKNKWYAVPFDKYNSSPWKKKAAWGISGLLLLVLLLLGFMVLRRRKKRSI